LIVCVPWFARGDDPSCSQLPSLDRALPKAARSSLPVAFVVAFAPILLFAIPAKVHVGADGVLQRWLGTRKFVKLSDIARDDLALLRSCFEHPA